jgi:hypothetical protein
MEYCRSLAEAPDKIVELPGVTPPIVSEELWMRANQNRIQRVSRDETRNEVKPVMLRGLVYCLRCDRKRYVQWNGQKTDLFRCSSKTDESPIAYCGARSVSVNWLTRRVWEKMRGVMRTKKNLLQIDENWTDEQKRDYLLYGGFRIYNDGKRFEIRLRSGEVVANFDESTVKMVAYGTNLSYR